MLSKNNIKGLLVVLFGLSLQLAHAQHEVRLNFSNLIFYEFNAEYEYGFQQNKSISLITGYVYGFPDATQPNRYFFIGPEYRVFVRPKKPASGFYFGFYMRYKNGYYASAFKESGDLVSNPNTSYTVQTPGNMNYEKVAAGISLGLKKVSPIGFTYGFFIGGGVNIKANYVFDGDGSNEDLFTPESYRYSYIPSQWDSDYWDLRFGIMIGFRF